MRTKTAACGQERQTWGMSEGGIDATKLADRSRHGDRVAVSAGGSEGGRVEHTDGVAGSGADARAERCAEAAPGTSWPPDVRPDSPSRPRRPPRHRPGPPGRGFPKKQPLPPRSERTPAKQRVDEDSSPHADGNAIHSPNSQLHTGNTKRILSALQFTWRAHSLNV